MTAAADGEAPSEEPMRAEVVHASDAPSGRRLEVMRTPEEPGASTAIAAAMDAALAQPGAPGAAEFMALAAQARILSLSGAAPKAMRDNPYIAFHVALIGRDFGLSVAAAAELVDVIDTGGGTRISLSPQLLNGQIRRLGLGSIIPVVRTPDTCVAAALGPNGRYDERCKPLFPNHRDDCECRDVLGTSMFTWEDAQMAGLVGAECSPGDHKTVARQNGRPRCPCNQGYITYPSRMLWWRAGGFAGDDYFPEASLGLYSPEALGVPVDDDGRAIDPSTVALPEGYEPAADVRAAEKAARDAAAAEPADVLDILDLQIRVAALPDDQRGALAEKWKEHDRLAGIRLDSLPSGHLRFATALIGGFESQARTATRGTDNPWDPNVARAQVVSGLAALAPQEPQEAAEPSEGDQDPSDPAEPQEEPQGGQDVEPEDDRPRHAHADDDPSLAEALADIQRVAARAPAELVDAVAAEVKAMHYANVDKIVAAHGIDPAGRHIDVRRMLAAGWLITERIEEGS